MKFKIMVGVVATIAVMAIFGLIKYLQISAIIAQHSSRPQPLPAVTSAIATRQDWPELLTAVGSLSAVEGAVLGIEEAGEVETVNFDSGSKVEAGTVMLELDTDVEDAQLKGLQAQLKLAEVTLTRQRALRERNANSISALDIAVAEVDNLRAEAARLSAIIKRKKIVAPFDGIAGIRKVNIGETLSAGTPVVELTTMDPLFADFTLPQQNLGSLKEGLAVEIKADAYPEQTFKGEITAIGSAVDPVTRSIAVQATLPNSEHLLRPGMFIRTRVILDKVNSVIAIPASSVHYAPYGSSVYIIESGPEETGRAVKSQTVQLGERRGDRIEIRSGLSPGEEVVSSGTFKIRPGIRVKINNSVSPGNQLNPQPPDA